MFPLSELCINKVDLHVQTYAFQQKKLDFTCTSSRFLLQIEGLELRFSLNLAWVLKWV